MISDINIPPSVLGIDPHASRPHAYAISFFVPGNPAPGGSKTPGINRRTGKLYVRDACKRNKAWRDVVATEARVAMIKANAPIMTGPLECEFDFCVQRPKSHYRAPGLLRPDAPVCCHTIRPDTTKLVRAVEDALTGIVWHDDAQVAKQTAQKWWHNNPGVHVTVRQIGLGATRNAGNAKQT